ncbi:hypothetical protein E2320_014368, partial [Naja naja]
MQGVEDFGQRFLQRNQGRLSKCSQCGKSFAHRSLLLIHRKLHKGNGSHLCFLCGKSFPGVWSFAKHLQSHPGRGSTLAKDPLRRIRGDSPNAPSVGNPLLTVPPFDPPEATREWIPPVFSLWELLSWSLELCQTSRSHPGVKPYKCAGPWSPSANPPGKKEISGFLEALGRFPESG